MSDFSNKERGECCQCENVANTQSQYPIGIGNIGTGNTSTMATFSSLPNGWEVRYGKSIFTENKRKNKSLENSTILSLSYGKIVVKKSPDEGLVPAEYSGYQILAPGDIVIRCTDLQNDQKSQRVGIVEVEGIITSAYLGLKVNDGVSSRYIAYWLKNWDATKEIYRYGSGLRQSLSWVDLKYLPIPLPPLPEQKAIVAYLDAETGRIDKAIAAEEKMIALLQERREIVINEAMGGGDFSRKDRKERKGWEASTIRRHFDITLGKMLCSNKLSDDYTLEKYFCAADVHFGDLATTDNKQMWFSHKEKDQYLIKNGDLLIVEGGAGAGGACVVQGLKENFYIQNSILRLRSRGTASERFVCYVLEGFVKRGYIEMACNKATIPHFTKEKVGDVPIPLPPLSEQEAIVERLDRETGKIDRAIEVKRRQIELLRERRQIVIDEVVTGKVKVA